MIHTDNKNNSNAEMMKLNNHFLILAQQQLTTDPLLARHKLGLTEAASSFISNLSPIDIMKLSDSGISAVTFRFAEGSLAHLTNYLSGDDLAITQAVLGCES